MGDSRTAIMEQGRPPEGCTCIWSTYFLNDGGHRASVYIAAEECPARPHPRVFVTDSPTPVQNGRHAPGGDT